MNKKDFYKKLLYAVASAYILTAMACTPQKEEAVRNELAETEALKAVENTVGETLGEVEIKDSATEGVESEYTVTELNDIKYASTTVNVRKGPDTTFEKLGTLTMNQEVCITGVCSANDWYRVAFNDEEGFVSGKYLAEQKVASWVTDLDIAETVSQIIVVAADGSDATVSMHSKDADGVWTEILSTAGKIGRNGIGKTKEGDGKTPTGVYHFLLGFGNKENPGCGLYYTKVDNSYYWVDDSDSAYYNQFVTTNEVTKDWDSAEHIAGVKSSYNYVLALDYNVDCVPEKGSAIFMHCTPTSGAGCIAIPEDKMVEIMQAVKEGCVVVIDSLEGVKGY